MEMSQHNHCSSQEMLAYVYIGSFYSLNCKTHVYVQKYFILVVKNKFG